MPHKGPIILWILMDLLACQAQSNPDTSLPSQPIPSTSAISTSETSITQSQPEPMAQSSPLLPVDHGKPTRTPSSEVLLKPVPKPFVDVKEVVHDLFVDMKYYTGDNFTGKKLEGYNANRCWLLQGDVSQSLIDVQKKLQRQGFRLKVFDCYRPRSASKAMVEWAKKNGKEHLLGTYIAERSNHNTGTAIDCTLVDWQTNQELSMDTGEKPHFDRFDEHAHFDYYQQVQPEIHRNRSILREVMENHGWKSYSKEWWHFSYPVLQTQPMHFPIE